MMEDNMTWHGTTILSVRKNGEVVVAGDGQVTFGNTVIKGQACLLYTSPSPRDRQKSRMPSSA